MNATRAARTAATLTFSVALVAGIGGVGLAADDGALPRLEPLAECFVPIPEGIDLAAEMDCGYVVVQQSRSGDPGQEVKVAYTRFSSGVGSAASPLFLLAGGPGEANMKTGKFAELGEDRLGPILETRDIVLVEQRGTGLADPVLDCPAIYALPYLAFEQGLDADAARARESDELRACIATLEAQGVDLDAFDSLEDAADVNDVRAALGYDRIIYHGSSYGTQLGQHLMRDFPDILEGVILDGANGLARQSWVEDTALDAQWGIDHLTEHCEADPVCAATYDIPALVDAALALFDDGPIPYTYTDPADASVTVDVEVTVEDMVNRIHAAQGDKSGTFSLPAILNVLVQGGRDAVAQELGSSKAAAIFAAEDRISGELAWLMHLAVVCSDDPVHSIDDVDTQGVSRYAELLGVAAARGYARYCDLVDVAPLPASTDEPVTTDVPTLLLSGCLDVATPTFRSQEVADALPNATLIVFPGFTHVQLGQDNACAFDVLRQFVGDPGAELDLTCVEGSPVLPFVLPDGTLSTDQSS
jgi:pimeloyl-ACP methyl ester carboxylesterase